MYRLGLIHEVWESSGWENNSKQSESWYRKAADKGLREAKDKLSKSEETETSSDTSNKRTESTLKKSSPI